MSVIRAFQPLVLGSDDTFRRFLEANWDCIVNEKGRDSADFDIGFGGMRRIEMIRIARRYGVDLDENLYGEDMKAKMEAAFLDGKFPVPDPQDEMKRMADELAELKAMVRPKVENMSFKELRKLASERGVFDVKDTHDDLIEKLA